MKPILFNVHVTMFLVVFMLGLFGGCQSSKSDDSTDKSKTPSKTESTDSNAMDAENDSVLTFKNTELFGDWEGEISVANQTIQIIVTFGEQDASIQIPQQLQDSIPLQDITWDAPKIHFEMASNLGTAIFDGSLEGDRIEGSFQQGGALGNFNVTKSGSSKHTETTHSNGASDNTSDNTSENTSENTIEELPYTEHEVSFSHDEASLTGTLTVPKNGDAFTAVILITGSGQQNRDEEVFGFKIFKIMADHLARKGYAVLRYDDRGMGGSTGEVATATSKDFVKDVKQAVTFLNEQSHASIGSIGLLGHSEGAIIALMAAKELDTLDFLIFMAGQTLPGDEILVQQSQKIYEANQFSDEVLEKQLAIQHTMFEIVRGNEQDAEGFKTDLEELLRMTLNELPAEKRESILNEKEYIQQQIESQLNVTNSPWFKFYIDYDPRIDLKTLDIPILALYGELDLQVPAESNMAELETIKRETGNDSIKIKLFPMANHLFQEAETGKIDEYPVLKKEFVPNFLPTISTWLDMLD